MLSAFDKNPNEPQKEKRGKQQQTSEMRRQQLKKLTDTTKNYQSIAHIMKEARKEVAIL